jgi:hypothetical protein
MDITELILTQHHEQRRAFAMLDEMVDDVEALTAVWSRLEVLLEVHAKAEEKFFYPRLLELGARGKDEEHVDDEVKDAVKDHNEIRDGIAKVRSHRVGTKAWWDAVHETREANDEHMAEEERDDLADFRHLADLQTRHDIAVQFITYESQHAAGIVPDDKDPDTYVEENK